MHKFLRYYSQNRIKVWTMILAIVFLLIIIQVLNNIAKEQNKNESENNNEIGVSSYSKESKSIITQGSISKEYQEEFGKIIDKFYTCCVNHEPQKAYDLLSTDVKRVLYPTEKNFEKLYYEGKFEGNKQYSFQSWTRSSDNIYIYQVKIYDNMLLTGKRNDEYIEDYVTIVSEEGELKLNINSYVGRKEISASNSNEIVNIKASFIDTYMDYKIYTFNIKNNTDKNILLDTRKDTDTTFITDEIGNNYSSFLYEIAEQDLILKPKEAKTIQIKFNNSYRTDMDIKSVNFSNIVDYDEYLQGTESIYSLKIDL